MERELLPDRRERFALEKIPRVFIRTARGLAVRALGHVALVVQHPRLLRAREFGRGEAEARNPLEFGDDGVKTAGEAGRTAGRTVKKAVKEGGDAAADEAEAGAGRTKRKAKEGARKTKAAAKKVG